MDDLVVGRVFGFGSEGVARLCRSSSMCAFFDLPWPFSIGQKHKELMSRGRKGGDVKIAGSYQPLLVSSLLSNLSSTLGSSSALRACGKSQSANPETGPLSLTNKMFIPPPNCVRRLAKPLYLNLLIILSC